MSIGASLVYIKLYSDVTMTQLKARPLWNWEHWQDLKTDESKISELDLFFIVRCAMLVNLCPKYLLHLTCSRSWYFTALPLVSSSVFCEVLTQGGLKTNIYHTAWDLYCKSCENQKSPFLPFYNNRLLFASSCKIKIRSIKFWRFESKCEKAPEVRIFFLQGTGYSG